MIATTFKSQRQSNTEEERQIDKGGTIGKDEGMMGDDKAPHHKVKGARKHQSESVNHLNVCVFSLWRCQTKQSCTVGNQASCHEADEIENKKSPFNTGPSNQELQQFNPDIGHCCTADNFQVDIRSHPWSSWNISAGKVFAADFIVKYSDAKIDNIEKRFSKHLGYLMKDYMCYGTKSPEHQYAVCKAEVRIPLHFPMHCWLIYINTATMLQHHIHFLRWENLLFWIWNSLGQMAWVAMNQIMRLGIGNWFTLSWPNLGEINLWLLGYVFWTYCIFVKDIDGSSQPPPEVGPIFNTHLTEQITHAPSLVFPSTSMPMTGTSYWITFRCRNFWPYKTP